MTLVRLEEEPTFFRYHKGARVARKTDSGTPNTTDSGTIVGGYVDRPPSGGAYSGAFYEIQRDDGLLFKAKELDLVPLDDEPNTIWPVRANHTGQRDPKEV